MEGGGGGGGGGGQKNVPIRHYGAYLREVFTVPTPC